jgi:simple sugar transport system permease protein
VTAWVVFLAQGFTAATPLVLAALGGVLSERAGVATIALEGYLLAGAFGAAVVALATGSVALAVLAALLFGALLGAVFALATTGLKANAIVAGVAVNLLAGAGTRVALKALYDSASNSPPLLERAAGARGLAATAMLEVLRSPLVACAVVGVLGLHLVFARTVFGLRVTACGEHPAAARSLGVSVPAVRTGALVAGGALAGLGGAQLTLQQHEFVAFMSGGRGFLALAAVILGRWRPVPAALWALAIGFLSAVETTLGPFLERRLHVPTAVLQATPFALTLLAVVGLVGRSRAPAALR